jgi:hypothetical protein
LTEIRSQEEEELYEAIGIGVAPGFFASGFWTRSGENQVSGGSFFQSPWLRPSLGSMAFEIL